MKTAKISLLCSAIALCFSSSVSAGQSLDQSYTPTSISGLMFGEVTYLPSPILGQAQTIPWLAQSFEVGLSGQFTSIDLLLTKRNVAHESMFGSLTISLYNIAGGMPLTPWAATTIQSSTVGYAPNDGAWLNVDFSAQNLSVVAGEKLAIVVHRPGTTAYVGEPNWGFSLPISWYGGIYGEYAKGDAFKMNGNTGNWERQTGYYDPALPGSDFGFRTYVTAVPEPETYAMLLAGLGLMGAVARRRKLAA